MQRKKLGGPRQWNVEGFLRPVTKKSSYLHNFKVVKWKSVQTKACKKQR